VELDELAGYHLEQAFGYRCEMNLALQLSLTRGLAESGRIDDAISRADRVADQCRAAGDDVGELRARLEQARWQVSVDPDRWLAALDALVKKARPAIGQDGDAAARAGLEHAAGYLDYNRCRHDGALAAFTRGMRHARQAGDLWFETSMRAMAATCVYLGPTPISEALPRLDEAKKQSVGYQPRFDIMK
jgi:hypothetical protein